MMNGNNIVFGLSNGKKIATYLAKNVSNLELGNVETTHFADGEIFIFNKTSTRGKKIWVVQSLSKPVNDNLMELLIFLDSLKRTNTVDITIIIPYLAYARQDRKNKGKEPISAKLILDLLTTAGAKKIITFDLHAPQIQGFFNGPVDDLRAMYSIFDKFAKDQKNIDFKEVVFVSPDYGGISKTRTFANILGTDIVIIDKFRKKANYSNIMNVIGNPEGKICIIIDDMIDTGGTIKNAIIALKGKGAKKIHILATHGVFSNNAIENITRNEVDSIYISNTIPKVEEINNSKIKIVSIEKVLTKIVNAQIKHHSTSSIYDNFLNKYSK